MPPEHSFAIVADDLTGAADSGAQLARAGYSVAVVFRGESPPPDEDLDAVVMDTDSRMLDPKRARERVLEAGKTVKGARIVYKKLDSTLRGPLAAELVAALEATGRSRIVVAPAFPGNGRSTRGGVQMVHGEPVHHTGLARDPLPVREGHIPSLLEDLDPIATLSIDDLKDPELVRRTVENSRCVVADAEDDSHLEALARSIPDPSSILWAGSAGLVSALGGVYPGTRSRAGTVSPVTARAAVAVVGSMSDVCREQLRRLTESPDVMSVPLDSSAVAGAWTEAMEDALSAARAALEVGRSIALYSTLDGEVSDTGWDPAPDGKGRRIAGALAEVVARLSGEERVEALVLTGGDTAVHVARGLGATGILLEGELEPGVAVGRLIGPRRCPVVTKAGGFGRPDTLRDALRALIVAEKERE